MKVSVLCTIRTITLGVGVYRIRLLYPIELSYNLGRRDISIVDATTQ